MNSYEELGWRYLIDYVEVNDRLFMILLWFLGVFSYGED